MKLHALMFAVAVATGSAFAAGAYDTQPAPQTKAGETMHKAGSEVREAGAEAKADAKKAGSEVKHAVKKHQVRHTAKKVHKEHHASAKHHGTKHASAKHHPMHAAAKHPGQHMASRSDTRMMGGAPAPVTDLNAGARERRMDDAYAHWRALPR
ncbi:MAG TPA: hypothetical protein VF522_09995 [Ramlibacter sp.]|uniref:hypothetical protein n=1 Tax=Ramlibacter sp. TaxID=1917967 RepID=UPI002ED5235F